MEISSVSRFIANNENYKLSGLTHSIPVHPSFLNGRQKQWLFKILAAAWEKTEHICKPARHPHWLFDSFHFFNEEAQTAEHILQRCQSHKELREGTWPQPTLEAQKLYGCLTDLQRIAPFISETGLTIWRSRRRRRNSLMFYYVCSIRLAVSKNQELLQREGQLFVI